MRDLLLSIRPNRIIAYLAVNDVFTWGLVFALNSIIGIYLAQKLGDSVLEFIGVGVFILQITKGTLQIPIGLISDKFKGEIDEIIFLVLGNSLIGLSFMLYPLIGNQYHFYALQFIQGIGMAFNLVNWRKLFAAHLDKGREGSDYAVYEVMMSFSIAIVGLLIGNLSDISYRIFSLVVVVIGFLIMCSSFWGYLIYKTKKTLHGRQQSNLKS